MLTALQVQAWRRHGGSANSCAAVMFTQAQLTRAVKAARAAGFVVARIEIDAATGKITLVGATEEKHERTPLDAWLISHAHSHEGD